MINSIHCPGYTDPASGEICGVFGAHSELFVSPQCCAMGACCSFFSHFFRPDPGTSTTTTVLSSVRTGLGLSAWRAGNLPLPDFPKRRFADVGLSRDFFELP